jgi:tRNA G46 methylase TrmB
MTDPTPDADRRVDPDTWTAPPELRRGDGARVGGTMFGSLLYEQPEHRADRDRIVAFVEPPGPIALEIGFDHGMRLLDHARRWPEVRWLGAEIRRSRVEAAAAHAPPNALLLRADGRTLLAAVIPPARLQWIYVLFPSPSDNPRHLLITSATAALLARALAPGGSVHVATDVPGMAAWTTEVFDGWRMISREAGAPLGPVMSRRERVCARDQRPVWRFDLMPPA